MATSPIRGPFDLSNSDLARLEPSEAVEVFHSLLVAEAIRTGRPVSGISVPKAITTADGGVDADVELPDGILLPAGLVRSGLTRYQLKTGAFSASTPSDIKGLLLQPKHQKLSPPFAPTHLNPRVKSCLDKGGTFIAVLFGSDAVGKTDDYGVKEIGNFLTRVDPKYAGAKIEILRANQLCASIKVLSPALALRLNGLSQAGDSPLQTLEFVQDSCNLEVARFERTDELDLIASAITAEANAPSGFKHIRVLGDAGAGKTHIVYSALAASTLRDHVLYCIDSAELDTSPPFLELVELSKSATVILVADECDFEAASTLQHRLKRVATNFLLISVFNQVGRDDALGDQVQLTEVPPLSDKAMSSVLAGYGIPDPRREWLIELCRGSPRAAHLIGGYISSNPEEDYATHFRRLDSVWELMICSPEGKDTPAGLARLTVARCAALFRRFTWGGAGEVEGRRQIAAVVSLVDSTMSSATLARAIEALRQRRVLQGRTTLYFSPKLLHIAMWRDWWDNFDHLFNNDWLRQTLSERMLDWFYEMLVYARESKAATRVVDALLAPDGPLASLVDFSKPGNPQLFFALAQAGSKAALRRLREVLENASEADRLDFRVGRREVVHGLERLAVPAADFFDAADCLLLLAESENETWSNNATGVFVSLFSLGYGPLAASELSPESKLPFLKRLLDSEQKRRRQLAVSALSESLRDYISRTDIGDTAGLRSLPDRWMPKTYGELWRAYAAHIDLLTDAADHLPLDEQDAPALAIVSNARSLLRSETLSNKVLGLLARFANRPSMRGLVVESIVSMLHFDRDAMPASLVEQLENLRAALTDSSFHDRLHRYVGLRLIEDNFSSTGEYTEDPPKTLIELRDEILCQPTMLVDELPWLVTEEAKNGFQFGSILGTADHALDLWTLIKNAWMSSERRSDYFIGGYLSGLFRQDVGLWELVIGELFETLEGNSDLLTLVWRSGMSDAVAWELFARCETGRIEAQQFRLFVYGGVVRLLPYEVVKRVVKILVSETASTSADAALDILQSRRRTNSGEPALLDLLGTALRHRSYVRGGANNASHDNMRDYHWTEGAKLLLKADPERARALAICCVQSFGSEGSVTDGYLSSTIEFFDLALERWPSEIWKSISKRLEKKPGISSFKLLTWLRGRRRDERSASLSGFERMPANLVLEWVGEDVNGRAPLIAQYSPPFINLPTEHPTLLRLILEKYGDRRIVRRAVHANFMTGMFWGPASQHYMSQLHEWRARLTDETNEFVRIWMEEEIEGLTATVQAELEREEAQG